MRLIMMVLAGALTACGQPASRAGEAAAQGNAPASAQADFVARCTAALVRANPQASRWAPDQCAQEWQAVVAAGPMAEAILAAAPISGAANPAALPGQLTSVRWDRRAQGTLLASGRLGSDLAVQIDRSGPTLVFSWAETGGLIPYDAVGALRVRGAALTMIGCSQLGVGEFTQVYRVAAPQRAPFMLTVYARSAPTAEAESFYNVSLNLAGQVQTLAQLRRDGSEWAQVCAY